MFPNSDYRDSVKILLAWASGNLYVPIFVCLTNASSVSGSVLTFYCVNLLLFIRTPGHWPYYYPCCKGKEITVEFNDSPSAHSSGGVGVWLRLSACCPTVLKQLYHTAIKHPLAGMSVLSDDVIFLDTQPIGQEGTPEPEMIPWLARDLWCGLIPGGELNNKVFLLAGNRPKKN